MPGRFAHFRQRIRPALRREAGRKQMVEQQGKLLRRLPVMIGLGMGIHTETPLGACQQARG